MSKELIQDLRMATDMFYEHEMACRRYDWLKAADGWRESRERVVALIDQLENPPDRPGGDE